MFLSPVREIVASRQVRVKVSTEQPEDHHWRGSQKLRFENTGDGWSRKGRLAVLTPAARVATLNFKCRS